MENNKVSNLLADAAMRVAERIEAKKGYEFEDLFVVVNYAAVKSQHIKKIGARAFGVFIVIRIFMNKDKIAFPTIETIADYSGISPNTVQKEVTRLVKHGWLQKTVKRNKKGKFDAARYLILQRDIVRGTGDPTFKQKPVSRVDNGS